MTDLRGVYWIGGRTGAGKSSVATALAERQGLERCSYDWHDARAHSARTRADRHPVRAAFLAMFMDGPPGRRRGLRAVAGAGRDGRGDDARASRNKLDRDALLTDDVRRTATDLGLATIELDGSHTLAQVIAIVELQLGTVESR